MVSDTDSKVRRVLGLDPGTRLVGWGVVEARGPKATCLGHGVLRARARDPLPTRLAHLGRGLRDVIRSHAPREVAIEEAFYGRDARAAMRLGEGRGAALLVLAEAGLEIAGYANNVVKRAVTGAGRASKEQVRAMVVRILDLRDDPETLDASDALALALCHLQRVGHLQRIGHLQRTGKGAQAPPGPPPRLKEAIRRARRGR